MRIYLMEMSNQHIESPDMGQNNVKIIEKIFKNELIEMCPHTQETTFFGGIKGIDYGVGN